MKRLWTGIIFGSVWLAILLLNSFVVVWGVVSIVGCIALHEYFSICLVNSERKLLHLAILVSSIPLLAAIFEKPDIIVASFLFSLFTFTLIVLVNYELITDAYTIIAKYCCGSAFVSLCAAHASIIMTKDDGVIWLTLLTIITVSSDTGAYYTGTNFGKNKLCPAISPGKTIEGFWGGAFFSIVLTSLSGLFLIPHVPMYKISLLAFILSCLGVAGDLTESIMKRANNVKDSGSILPGHGGILDRIDSLLATTPALFYVIHLGFI